MGEYAAAEVKDVCPIVGVEVGARVRAHFYYQNGQKSKSWREAQAGEQTLEVENCGE